MRRVYHAYAQRLVLHPVTVHGVGILALVFALTYFVSVPHVVQNLLGVKVGQLGNYAYSTVAHTEIWTLLIIGGIIMSLFSLRVRLTRTPSLSHHTTQVV